MQAAKRPAAPEPRVCSPIRVASGPQCKWGVSRVTDVSRATLVPGTKGQGPCLCVHSRDVGPQMRDRMSGDVLASNFRQRPLCWIHMSSSTAGAEPGPPRSFHRPPRPAPRLRVALVPQGRPAAALPRSVSLRFGDHFEWNKVTSCIHNILSGQRWIEHYGEVLIRNTQDSSCHCKITFCKVGAPSLPVHPQWLTPGRGRTPKCPAPTPTPGQVLELQRPRGAGCRVQPEWPRPPPALREVARGALPGDPARRSVHLETQ